MQHKILVVDDEIEICKIVEVFLKRKSFDVIVAHSGEEALGVIAKEKLAMILMDRRMPGMGGAGLLRELKRRKSATPVIILTGSQDIPGHMNEIVEMGYPDFLFKPLDLDILYEKIKQRLGL